jgi:flagellar M-ring protein FliF
VAETNSRHVNSGQETMAETGKADKSGAGGQALAVIARGQKVLQAMPPKKRTWLGVGGLMLAAVIAALSWYANRPDWRVLYTGLEARDAATVTQELGAAGIAFRTNGDQSGIEVPSDLLDKARMEVAAKGMPQTGRLGFELFDKPNWVGSEFDEKVNYQRALEGELEHTIGSLAEVKSARVHLVLPAEGLFTQEQKVAKASVVLKLKSSSLQPEQVEAIRRLVAGAVENLSSENVTLVDADGRLDLQPRGKDAHEGDAEQALEAKLVAMLEPLAGVGNVRAVVNAAYDEGAEDRVDEVYDPTLTATLSLQKNEQANGAAARASGVPGTASNTPAAAPVGAVQGSAAAAAPGVPPLLQQPKDALPVYPERGFGSNQTTKEESGTYAVTKHTLHREDAPGRLRRMTVAVVVNDRMTTEGVGKLQHTVWKPRNAEEMRRIEGLAQAAVGYDVKRGDAVVVENVSFGSNVPEAPLTGVEKVVDQGRTLLHAEPGAARAVMMAFIGLLVVMLVLRPVARQVVLALKEPPALKAGAAGRVAMGGAQTAEALTAGAAAAAEAAGEQVSQVVVEQVAEHIRRKPVQSTRLLENWIVGPQESA